jgi:7-cyano-7-deazaguanine synthase
MRKKAVVLFSGGIDSTTCLALAASKGFECYTLSFDYGQKHHAELNAAAALSQKFGAKQHKLLCLPIGDFGCSALTDAKITVPDFTNSSEIPITYVPARNSVFLSIALSWAETLNAKDLFIGVNAVDYSHYPDCRPEFIAQFQRLADLGTKAGVKGDRFIINTPLLYLSKAEIIQLGFQLGIDYSQTVSCYQANAQGHACGICDSCMLRKKGFNESTYPDPTRYIKA